MTAKQIDLMPIEELESLSHNLTTEQLTKWTGSGYDGATYVNLLLEALPLIHSFCAYSGLKSPKAYE
tara:strand:+ start:990 stop:1190 length:201 start_codon:yes stop_codon:yes gene_type:complete